MIRMSWPVAVSMLSYSVMTLVDTLFVGRLGSAALAGVGLAGMAAFVAVCFPMGLIRSTKVLVSQSIGAGKPANARLYSGAGVLLALGLGVVTLAIGLVMTRSSRTSPQPRKRARSRPRICGSLVRNTSRPARRGSTRVAVR